MGQVESLDFVASPMFVGDSVEYLADLPQTEEGIVSKEAFVEMMGDIKARFSSVRTRIRTRIRIRI